MDFEKVNAYKSGSVDNNQDLGPSHREDDSFDPNEGGPMSLTINNTGANAGY
jgi:hypothetical protein